MIALTVVEMFYKKWVLTNITQTAYFFNCRNVIYLLLYSLPAFDKTFFFYQGYFMQEMINGSLNSLVHQTGRQKDTHISL